ncbi:hypothetical protein BDB01DRAFT_606144 [Pilobolus umbonatus]|nr:hypothetical protein BDB01DRAFT_606144 [Pilobolus umbonatus]
MRSFESTAVINSTLKLYNTSQTVTAEGQVKRKWVINSVFDEWLLEQRGESFNSTLAILKSNISDPNDITYRTCVWQFLGDTRNGFAFFFLLIVFLFFFFVDFDVFDNSEPVNTSDDLISVDAELKELRDIEKKKWEYPQILDSIDEAERVLKGNDTFFSQKLEMDILRTSFLVSCTLERNVFWGNLKLNEVK